jgi:hypothetical protein
MNKALLEGLSDAIGFVGGALLGFWLGRVLGFDIFAAGYTNASIAGIVLVGHRRRAGPAAGAPLAAQPGRATQRLSTGHGFCRTRTPV